MRELQGPPKSSQVGEVNHFLEMPLSLQGNTLGGTVDLGGGN